MPPRPAPPECPRCGYDLSGAVGAWPEGSCPCEGRCSECGLEVLWRDVLNPAYAMSDLFFETARRKFVRAFFRTWWQSLRPWRLWRGAQMQFPVRAGRLGVFVVLATGLVWAVLAVVITVIGRMGGVRWFGWSSVRPWAMWRWFADGMESLWPIEARFLAPSNIALPPWLVLGWLWMVMTLLMLRLVPQTMRKARVRVSHVVRIWAYSLVGAPVLLFVPSIGERSMRACSWLEAHLQPFVLDHPGIMNLGLLGAWGGWMVLCWGSAGRHYLRLERPWLVAGVLVFLGGLVVVTLGVMVALGSRSGMEWMMDALS
ncbi:MAG TPA: hypothetical protein PKE29_05005 [Phycisphaerales bacterium]|nr:hypothetical protein [Phycisphaerales bacterium]